MAKERIKTVKPITQAKLKPADKHDDIIRLANEGKNINQIAAMLTLHSQYVKQVIDKANENL